MSADEPKIRLEEMTYVPCDFANLLVMSVAILVIRTLVLAWKSYSVHLKDHFEANNTSVSHLHICIKYMTEQQLVITFLYAVVG